MNEVWPPPYRVRINARAKRINLRLSPSKGLELVIPHSSFEKDAIDFLHKKRAWITKYLPSLDQPSQKNLPKQIILPALQQSWTISYEEMPHLRNLMLLTQHNEIKLIGLIQYDECINQLKNWLQVQAERYLLLLLKEISKRINLSYQALTIRRQKTRWGSCSASQNINLNYKLILAPFHLIEYVIIHELCHTVHFNHGSEFWNLVGKHCPEHQEARRQLKKISKELPDWIV